MIEEDLQSKNRSGLQGGKLEPGTKNIHTTPSSYLEQNITPSSLEFWRELKADWESIGYNSTSLRTFLVHYHPSERGVMRSQNPTGKYRPLWESFVLFEERNNSQSTLESYIKDEFKPPSDQPELAKTVNEVRGLLEIKEKKAQGWQSKILEEIPSPAFWQEFSDDLSLARNNPTFRQFLMRFNPRIPEDLAEKHRHVPSGKYRPLLNFFHTPQYYKSTQEALKVDEDLSTLDVKGRNKVLFKLAPPEVQLQLSSRFPKEFGEELDDVLNRERMLPDEAKFILDVVANIRSDHREAILTSLAKYITKVSSGYSLVVAPSELAGALEKAVKRPDAEELEAPPASISELIQAAEALTEVIKNSNSERKEISVVSTELLDSLASNLYAPLFKAQLYKPAAAYWTAYQDTHQGEEMPSGNMLVGQVKNGFKTSSKEVYQTASGPIKDFIDTQVLPAVYAEFGRIGDRAPSIKYFRKKDAQGKPKHLFLHQVEGTLDLIDGEGGVLSDEPGTGKTVELALAALNLLDKKPATDAGEPDRVIVVGSKTVISNWEGELKLHLEPDVVDVANINFTDDDEDYYLDDRIAKFKEFLDNPSNRKQFGLVNYDVFREPEFQSLLEQYKFKVSIVDEAHNVKSRFLESILDDAGGDEKKRRKVAKRTKGLYSFLQSDSDMAVFVATSTPFVKDLVEPLILAHLANPNLIPAEKVKELMKDPIGTHKAIRPVMKRRTKEEIADLPPKETQFVPIDLSTMNEAERINFEEKADAIFQQYEGKFARFYAMLALEGQAKFPWLIEKVNQFKEEGKKFVIFTPFVSPDERLTAPISTAAISSRLRSAGIDEVTILDGTVSDNRRTVIQEEFRQEGGLEGIVGNYEIAGESITLCSEVNNATEVILFIPPNAISRYIQAVDRIHRFGQNKKVTIWIPFVTNDPLGRAQGTYDERIASRLTKEIAKFGSVVDGLFFVESEDFYQSIARGEMGKADGNLSFDFEISKEERARQPKKKQIKRQSAEPKKPPRKREFKFDKKETEDKTPSQKPFIPIQERESSRPGEKVNLKDDHLASVNFSINDAERDEINAFLTRIQQYPRLTHEQTKFLFHHLRAGTDLEDLHKDDQFASLFDIKPGSKLDNAFFDSKNLKELIANCNLRLVAQIARGWFGLPYSDKIDEGVFGLYNAIDRFDPDRQVKLSSGEVKTAAFSTIATSWIRQSILRAIADTGSMIRIPVHTKDAFYAARRVSQEFLKVHEREPTLSELRRALTDQGKLSPGQISGLLDAHNRQVLRVDSLDAAIEYDQKPTSGRTVGDQVVDFSVDVEESVTDELLDDDKRKSIEAALGGLRPRERRILELRFGLGRNGQQLRLEEIAEIYGITRQAINYEERRAIEKLRRNPKLRFKRREELGNQSPFPRRLNYSMASENETPIKSTQQIIAEAKSNSEVWNMLSHEEQSLLNHMRNGVDYVVAERLAVILGVSPAIVANRITSAVNIAEEFLADIPKARDFQDVSERRLVGYTYEEIAKDLGKKTSWVEAIVGKLKREEELKTIQTSNPAAKLKVSTASDPKLYGQKDNAKTETNRDDSKNGQLTRKQSKILDFKVELLVSKGENLSYREMAETLGYTSDQIGSSIQRLTIEGKLRDVLNT